MTDQFDELRILSAFMKGLEKHGATAANVRYTASDDARLIAIASILRGVPLEVEAANTSVRRIFGANPRISSALLAAGVHKFAEICLIEEGDLMGLGKRSRETLAAVMGQFGVRFMDPDTSWKANVLAYYGAAHAIPLYVIVRDRHLMWQLDGAKIRTLDDLLAHTRFDLVSFTGSGGKGPLFADEDIDKIERLLATFDLKIAESVLEPIDFMD